MGELRVRVQPRASRSEIVGERAGELVVRVTAPPAGGRANDAVRKLLAKRLGVAPSRISIGSGQNARSKLIRVEGVETSALRRRLDLDG